MNLRKQLLLQFALLFCFLLSNLNGQTAEEKRDGFRQWKSSSGKFSVVAKLLDVADDVVELQTNQGETIKVKLDQLSESDRQFVSKYQKKDGIKKKKYSIKSVGIELETATRLQIPKTESWNIPGWEPQSQPLNVLQEVVLENDEERRLSRSSSFFFDSSKQFIFCARNVYDRPMGSSKINRLRTVAFDVNAFDLGKTETAPIRFRLPARPIAVSASLKNILVTKNGRFGCLTTEDDKIIERANWNIVKAQNWIDGRQPNTRMVRFVGEDYLLTWNSFFDDPTVFATLSFSGSRLSTLSLWDLENKKLAWTVPALKPVVSPDEKTAIAMISSDKIIAIDIPSGRIIGSKRLPAGGTLSVSPSGKHLLCVDALSQVARIYELKTLKLKKSFFFNAFLFSVLGWASEDQFLVQLGPFVDVFDVNYAARIWRYKFPIECSGIAIDANGRCWHAMSQINMKADSPAPTVKSFQIPHPGLKRWMSLNRPDDFLKLKPGTRISVSVKATVNDASEAEMVEYERQKELLKNNPGGILVGEKRVVEPNVQFTTIDKSKEVRKILERKLVEAGFHIANNAPTKFDFLMTPEPELHEKLMTGFRSPTGYLSIAFSSSIVRDGEVIWRTGICPLSQRFVDTTKPDAYKFLEKISFGTHFSTLKQIGTNSSTVNVDGTITDKSNADLGRKR